MRHSSSSVASQETEVARFRRERDEAQEQQAATADVLKVISHSTFDLQTVLNTLVETAAQLCQAEMALLFRREADAYTMAANYGFPPEFERFVRSRPLTADRGTIRGRVLLEGKVVHVADVAVDPEYRVPEAVRLANQRSTLGVPLLREGKSVGVIILARTRVEPFSEQQIELVRTFAAQAVIAIENARLLHELRQRTNDLSESLEQQTATSEVLKVISSSPGDVQPVFEVMLENAVRICDAKFGVVYRCEGDAMRFVAMHNVPPALAALGRDAPFRPGPKHYLGPLTATKTVIHVADLSTEQGYIERRPEYVASVEAGGVRTYVAVPMLKRSELIGVFLMGRQDVRPFTDKQIELVQNFAAQVVIAIENTRLLNELRESLQQQTATADAPDLRGSGRDRHRECPAA